MARELNAEIISVDSALVYRGMDIGTAKPTEEEKAIVPHHLIDICEPWQSYSAARFVDDACQAIASLREQGKRALLVGGTMLYYKALEEGLAELPDADAALRKTLSAEADVRGWPAIHAELALVDADAAARIHPNDPQRIQRAMEVYRLTGTPMSELQRRTVSPLSQDPIKFSLIPRERAWLHERIQRRFDAMVNGGFLDEVRTLMNDDRNHLDLPAIRSVGYRQAWGYLQSTRNESSESVSDTDWVDKAVAATRQLAKRQLTWLRGMHNVHAMECDVLSVSEQKGTMLKLLEQHGILKND